MDSSTLVGRSILVLEEEPFVACCLQILLEGAGAKVHSATSADEALRFIDGTRLSAAVLSCSKTTRGHRRVVQRLARFDLPLLLCKGVNQNDAWPGIQALIKPIIGRQLVESLHRLILADGATAERATRDPIGSKENLKAGERRFRFAETPS
ncbi:MAG: hypothetical protein HC869_02410 [Rhodospirillales bacterium]|nr:hypothetical protein [Rhodospirillales bacterium]